MCTTSVCLGRVKLYSSVQMCTHNYSPSVQDVYSSKVYLYSTLIYIYISAMSVCVCACPVYMSYVRRSTVHQHKFIVVQYICT